MANVRWDILQPKEPASAAVTPLGPPIIMQDSQPCQECGCASRCNACFKQFAAEQNILVQQGLVDPLLYRACMPPAAATAVNKSGPSVRSQTWSSGQCLTGICLDYVTTLYLKILIHLLLKQSHFVF